MKRHESTTGSFSSRAVDVIYWLQRWTCFIGYRDLVCRNDCHYGDKKCWMHCEYDWSGINCNTNAERQNGKYRQSPWDEKNHASRMCIRWDWVTKSRNKKELKNMKTLFWGRCLWSMKRVRIWNEVTWERMSIKIWKWMGSSSENLDNILRLSLYHHPWILSYLSHIWIPKCQTVSRKDHNVPHTEKDTVI